MAVHQSSGINRQVLTNAVVLPGISMFGHYDNTKATPPLCIHDHDASMELVLVVKGVQQYQVDGRLFFVRGGSVFITKPYEKHSTDGAVQSAAEIYWLTVDLRETKRLLHLSRDASRELILKLKNINNHMLVCPKTHRNQLIESFSCVTSDNPLKQAYGRNLLADFLYGIVLQEQAAHPELSTEMKQAVEYMETHAETSISIKEVADYTGFSVSRFMARFKEEVGSTPGNYITRLKIEHAKELLRTGMSITETALTLGFNSSDYFSTVFKKITLQSPTEFRKFHQ